MNMRLRKLRDSERRLLRLEQYNSWRGGYADPKDHEKTKRMIRKFKVKLGLR